uniref:Zinc finger protein 518A n=1 Tax=Salvator merianae TaxID=96440 RepID=A0A8D0CCQ9_SALMN
MLSEQEPLFCIQNSSLLQENVFDRIYIPVSDTADEKSRKPRPTISEILSYGLKNVKIELPRVCIPNRVICKQEISRYMKLFRCKEKPTGNSFVQVAINRGSSQCSEVYVPHNKPGLCYEGGLKTSAKILNFSCTKCRNNIRYSPNDLQKHFQLLHHGELPSYPCEMCNFSANDFQSFNQHRRTHRSTLVKCEICNDDSRYTLLDLTKHFTSKHCINGHFQCERCRFSTQDVGTFVQHIHRHNEIEYKCDKCHYASFSEEESQKHVASHTGTFPFSCQYCNYMASRKNYLLKHYITSHGDHLYAKDKVDTGNNEKKMKPSTGLKLILKRYKTGASRKALWRRKRITSSNCRIGEEAGQNVRMTQPKSEVLSQAAKESHLHDDRSLLSEKHIYSGGKPPSGMQHSRAEDALGSGLGVLKKAVHGPTVLMVKNNKISVPANYSAKFMGFKMVDGKQHIVIKLLPTDKQSMLSGKRVGGAKEGLAGALRQTVDGFSSPLGTRHHEINQQMPRNNSVHSLTASPLSCSNQYSRKIKQESKSSYSWNTPRTVGPPVVVVGKCASQLPVKPDSTSLPCDFVAKARSTDTVSWSSCIPQDQPRVLSSAGIHMLHYDPMKKAFPSELKVQNGEVNGSSKYNNVCCQTTDFSNQAPLPFHNYSKIGILDRPKDPVCSSSIPSRCLSETSSQQHQATGLNLERRSSQLPFHNFVDSSTVSVFSNNQFSYATNGQHCVEKHDGQRYSNAKMNHVLEHVPQKSKQENVWNAVNTSSLMPKITSVFSLQSNQASTFLSPEVNQSLQDVLKGQQPAVQQHSLLKTGYEHSFPNNKMDCKPFACFRDSAAAYSLTHFPPAFKTNLNANCSPSNEVAYTRNEGQVSMTSCRTEGRNSLSRTVDTGALVKTQTNSVITKQLEKDKLCYRIHSPNTIHSADPGQKKPVFLQSSPSRFFVPLRLAHQQGLQVVSGKPNLNSSDVRATKCTASPLLLNKGPGMVLTFGSGSLGTISNATENNSQVLERTASKQAGPASEMDFKTDTSGNVRHSPGVSVCSGPASASSCIKLQKQQCEAANAESRISSVKILTGFQSSKAASLESGTRPDPGQEQPVYALLPDGRQAVFLKCMAPNRTLVQNHSTFQGTACPQNSEPKKPGTMQQKLFLKIKTCPDADNCQPASGVGSSLQLSNMHSLNTPALDQKKTSLSPSNALSFPAKLMPANAWLASEKSKDPFTYIESIHSSKHTKAQSQKSPSDPLQTVTANMGSSLGSQMSSGVMGSKISKARRHSKRSAKVSDPSFSQKNRNLKRKAKDDLEEPPRKKILHRKCKEKNQTNVNELESLIQAPCRPRVSKDTVRTLKLLPFNSNQLIKCPRRNQPVVVLNHPDADVPEVVNVMKTIAKFKGHVLKVSLSKRTVEALLEPACYSSSLYIITNELSRRKRKILKPVSPVKERFVLKLTLKKTSKNNYQIVKTTSDNTLKTKFSCWFCGRIFDNQDNWVGHGQRHLMEATRDWNSLS